MAVVTSQSTPTLSVAVLTAPALALQTGCHPCELKSCQARSAQHQCVLPAQYLCCFRQSVRHAISVLSHRGVFRRAYTPYTGVCSAPSLVSIERGDTLTHQ